MTTKYVQTLAAGFILRLAVILAGDFIDQAFYPVQFTDIDYRVYSEAAEYILQGSSPYERQTYRYPPVLSAILAGNFVFHRIFGKVLFALFDILIAYELERVVRISCQREDLSLMWMRIWCANPIAIYISCRGSVDSVSSWLVLYTLRNMLLDHFDCAAVALGFVVYFRMYPIIYAPLLAIHILSKTWDRESLVKAVRFGALLTLTALMCGLVSFYVCGKPYLDHALLYHFSRRDHRHNFSPTFYLTYLESIDPQPDSWTQLLTRKAPAICQCVLLAAVTCKVGTLSLAKSMLILTLIFVAFNSVITGQYFLWYLILFPVAFPNIIYELHIWWKPFVVLAVAIGWWLFNGYRLEFLGQNGFLDTWLASIIFLCAHAYLIASSIR